MFWSIIRGFGCQFVKNTSSINAAASRVHPRAARATVDTWTHTPKRAIGKLRIRFYSSVTTMASSAPSVDKVPEDYRLPLNVRPTHYDVTLWTDLEKETFNGFVKIDLDVKAETSSIIFNAADLVFGDVFITSTTSPIEIKTSPAVDKEMERASINLPTALSAGSTAQLKLNFAGKFASNMMGYYKSSWERDGKKEFYSLTQFEPTSARSAFPCWDEPLLKATFTTTMISRCNTVNLSNMPVASEEIYKQGASAENDSLVSQFSSLSREPEGQWKITRFDTTPPMSTYLVAFANGSFEYLESSYKSPLSGKSRSLRVYSTPDIIHQTKFALDVKAKILPLYEKLFDVEYPLPKLDSLVASDFDAGAMENWGLIMGRTSVFLLDPKNSDVAAKKLVATVVSHEVAHMWFGDITTMAWWDNLYLNEGFATMVGEVTVIEKLFPEWKVESEFVNVHMKSALNLDAKLSSHPIEVDCPDARQIQQIFDSLSYSKAASVLRMLLNYVGEDNFLKGVSIYLKKHLYANSVTRDLWDGISEASGVDVAKMMNNWVSKMGYPVIKVTESKGGIHVRQDRFLETGIAEAKDNETIWTVPLAILSVDSNGRKVVDHKTILDTREAFVPLDTSKPWKLNTDSTGVYYVLYTPERLQQIAEEAVKEDSVLSLNDRLALINENIALAKAGLSPISGVFDLIQSFKNEKEYFVWSSIGGCFSTVLTTWWENPKVSKLTDEFRKATFAPIAKRLGFEYSPSESTDISLLRTQAIGSCAESGDKDIVNELRSRFAHLLKTGDDSRIPADLQKITYAMAVKYGGREEYDAMKAIYEKPKSPTARLAAIRAMGASEDLAIAQETLEYSMTKAKEQDVSGFFAGVSTNKVTRRTLAKFVQDNYDTLYSKFAGGGTLNRLIQISFAELSTEQDAQAVEEFFKDKDVSRFNLTLAQTLDGIRAKAKWIEKSTSDLESWLERWNGRRK